MNLKQYDQREHQMKEAKKFCDALHKLHMKKTMEGGSYDIDIKDVPDTFRSMGHVATITITGAYNHKVAGRYSQ